MATPTPGPWSFSGHCVWGGRFGDTFVGGTMTGVGKDEEIANGLLIAAAPDLLAACKAALYPVGDTPEQVTAQLRAAIARAEGRTL